MINRNSFSYRTGKEKPNNQFFHYSRIKDYLFNKDQMDFKQICSILSYIEPITIKLDPAQEAKLTEIKQ